MVVAGLSFRARGVISLMVAIVISVVPVAKTDRAHDTYETIDRRFAMQFDVTSQGAGQNGENDIIYRRAGHLMDGLYASEIDLRKTEFTITATRTVERQPFDRYRNLGQQSCEAFETFLHAFAAEGLSKPQHPLLSRNPGLQKAADRLANYTD